jgi:IS5 family transposase
LAIIAHAMRAILLASATAATLVGRRAPFPLAVMLRIYCLQQWYNLSDPGAEEALYDIQSMRAFCGLELGREAIPDETTILNFRHLLERHDLTKAVFAAVAEHLEARGALLRGGTIVDATLIAASPSTKNREGKRDPQMRSSKKGNQWYFGMKAHVGVDAQSGLVHTAGVTTGSRRLGHANPTVTLNTYGHLFKKDDSAAASAIEAALRTRSER